MKEFLKDVVINILVDLTSKYLLALLLILFGGVSLLDLNKFIERKEYVTAGIIYILYTIILTGISLIIYEILTTKNKRMKLKILVRNSKETGGMWDDRESIWIEILNDEKIDFIDCFVYLNIFDDNGINHLSEVTKITNKFEWQNYSKEQNKKVRGQDKERVNIAFSKLDGGVKKFFCFEGNNAVLIPEKYRFNMGIIVSGKFKGIRKEFIVSYYLVHEMLDFEKTMTKRFYLEPKLSS